MAPKDANISGDWQTNCTGTKQRVARLYQVEEWTDCCFEFDDEIIKAHKLILSMSSPVFAAMFFGVVAQKDSPIAIVDIQADAFTALLEYIYTDEVNIDSLGMACDLYYAAKKYMLPHLMKECVTYITSNLAPNNVCQLYEFANMHDEIPLMNKCLQIFSNKTLDIFRGNSFKKASVSTMTRILSMEHLNIRSELDLFKALARYAKAMRERDWQLEKSLPADVSSETSETTEDSSCTESTSSTSEAGTTVSRNLSPGLKRPLSKDTSKKDDSDNDKSDDDDVDKIASQIRSMLCKIRFLTLSPKEFADCKILTSLLTKEEMLALSMNIASRHTLVPMPTGFCTSRLLRNMEDRSKKTVTFRSVVNNVKNLTYYESVTFYARNIPWYVTIKPVYKTVHGYVHKAFAVFLYCGLEYKFDWSCRADYEFRLTSNKPGARMPTFKINHIFSNKKSHCGCTLKWESIMDPVTGNLEDGAINFEVKIAPDEPVKR